MDFEQDFAAEKKVMRDCWNSVADTLKSKVKNWNEEYGTDWKFEPYDDHFSISRQLFRYRPYRRVLATLSCEFSPGPDRSTITVRYFEIVDSGIEPFSVQTFHIEPSDADAGAVFLRDDKGKDLKFAYVANEILFKFLKKY